MLAENLDVEISGVLNGATSALVMIAERANANGATEAEAQAANMTTAATMNFMLNVRLLVGREQINCDFRQSSRWFLYSSLTMVCLL